MTPLVIKGRVSGTHELPCPPGHVSAGDTYLVGSDLYSWDGRQWNSLGAMGESAPFVQKKECDLGYKGIAVKVWSEYDVGDLFIDPLNLDDEDLAVFETTYPEDYKTFAEEWSKERARQLAGQEINGWRDKYEL